MYMYTNVLMYTPCAQPPQGCRELFWPRTERALPLSSTCSAAMFRSCRCVTPRLTQIPLPIAPVGAIFGMNCVTFYRCFFIVVTPRKPLPQKGRNALTCASLPRTVNVRLTHNAW